MLRSIHLEANGGVLRQIEHAPEYRRGANTFKTKIRGDAHSVGPVVCPPPAPPAGACRRAPTGMGIGLPPHRHGWLAAKPCELLRASCGESPSVGGPRMTPAAKMTVQPRRPRCPPVMALKRRDFSWRCCAVTAISGEHPAIPLQVSPAPVAWFCRSAARAPARTQAHPYSRARSRHQPPVRSPMSPRSHSGHARPLHAQSSFRGRRHRRGIRHPELDAKPMNSSTCCAHSRLSAITMLPAAHSAIQLTNHYGVMRGNTVRK